MRAQEFTSEELKNVDWITEQGLPVYGCIGRYNNDPLQPEALESCIKANVCLLNWLANDKVEQTKLRNAKSLGCVDKHAALETYYYLGCERKQQKRKKS